MGIVNMLFPATWYDSDRGEWVDAIVFVRDEGITTEVVFEPRQKGEVEGFLLTRDEWQELKAFVDAELARLDDADKDGERGDSGNQ